MTLGTGIPWENMVGKRVTWHFATRSSIGARDWGSCSDSGELTYVHPNGLAQVKDCRGGIHNVVVQQLELEDSADNAMMARNRAHQKLRRAAEELLDAAHMARLKFDFSMYSNGATTDEIEMVAQPKKFTPPAPVPMPSDGEPVRKRKGPRA